MRARVATGIILLLIASAIPGCRCTDSERGAAGSSIRFLVTGNTYPVSPFTGFSERLPAVIDGMNRENPVLVVHTGNIVHGGYDWMGIRETDLLRQFRSFKTETGRLNALLYTCAGEKDLYNASPDIYQRALQKNLYYSFNYGRIHFVVLHFLKNSAWVKSDGQIEWLKDDLEKNRNAAAIFVFTNHAPFNYRTKKSQHVNTDELHRILSRYPVVAVFSGNSSSNAAIQKDGITYHVAGCGGFNRVDWCNYYVQYHVVDYNGKDLRVKGKKMNFRNE